MEAWSANAVALFLVLGGLTWLALGLLWRIGSWQRPAVETLTLDEGLRIGAQAPPVAAYVGEQEAHLAFGGCESFVAFGTNGCEPCNELLHVAATHPATKHLRRVYIADSEAVDGDRHLLASWEIYRFHDEDRARAAWRAPVSPYFHLLDSDGRVVAKGLANRSEHLDRLLVLRPPAFRTPQQTELALREPLRSRSKEA